MVAFCAPSQIEETEEPWIDEFVELLVKYEEKKGREVFWMPKILAVCKDFSQQDQVHAAK